VNEAASLHFEVLSGLYSGLTGHAICGTSLIGSGLDADIVFVEQGLEPHHFRATFLCDSVEIEALATGISFEGSESVAAGERGVFSLPVVMHAGAMSIRWSVQDSVQADSTGPSRVSILAVAIVVLSLLGMGALSTIFFRNAGAGAASTDSAASVEAVPKLVLNRPDDRTTDAAAGALQEEVDRSGLLNIKVNSRLGVVSAEGSVSPAMVRRWQEIQQWFDHRTNGTLMLLNEVTVKEEKAPSSIAVEAVWHGAQPYLLIGGQKYFVGAQLNDGWIVNHIEERGVLLSRNGRLAAIPY
jgi:type III secretion protein D